MKSTPTWFRAIVTLALVSLAAGCASSSGSPNIIDAGPDTSGAGGSGSGGSGSGGSPADAGDASADSHGDATDTSLPPAPALAVLQGTVPITTGSTVTVMGAVVNASAPTVFTIKNTGNAALTVSGVTVAPMTVFALSAQPGGTVAANASETFTVVFSPTAVGTSTATVTITSNAGADFSFTISAQATAAPQPAIAVSGSAGDIANGGTLAFGMVAVGSPKDQIVTIRNPGSAPLVLTANPTVTGADFTLKTPPGTLTIAAGGMTTFTVTLTPALKGDKTGSISIASNSPDNPTFTVMLTGTATITATGFNVTGANGATSIDAVGGTLQLTATVVPDMADNPGVTWSSGTPGVATVDANGLVTAVASGQTTITATAADGSGITGTLTITVAIPFVYFVTQAAASTTATTATLANGTFTVSSTFGNSGNAFKFVSPNYYGTNSNGFIAFSKQMAGDFSISATVTVTNQIKNNNACGLGLGMTTGFLGSDSYAYTLMRNATTANAAGAINEAYVSAAGTVSLPTTGANIVSTFANNTPTQLTFSRTGTNVTFSATPMGGTAVTNTIATTLLTNGTNFGANAVYPAISFNNIAATITNLIVKDGTGATVFDSATGLMVTYIPPSLTLSPSSATMLKNASTQVTATAAAVGGTVSTVTAVAGDSTIVSVAVANGATNSTITLTGLKGGTTNVTVTNTGDPNPASNSKTLQVTVNDFATSDPYGSLATVAYPAPGATAAYTDGELALTFDSPPTLNPGGSILIYKVSDGTLVDTVAFGNETQTFPTTGTSTTTINVGSQLARVSGNTVFFTPHLGKLAYGGSYYVGIPTTAISGTNLTLNGTAFNGLSNLNTVATWTFTTRAAPTINPANVTVDGAQASTANFRTLQGALSSVATMATNVTINVAAGTYNELIHYTGPGLAQTITIVGPTGNNVGQGSDCVVQYTNGNFTNPSTQGRASAYFSGTNLVLQNITFRNNAVRAALQQAEALYFASGAGSTLAANNSSFFSNQDTIQTSGRAWFYNCHVEGNVDFLWGTSDAALFENCSMRFINDVGTGTTNYSLFVARTGATIAATSSGTVGKGYVMLGGTVSVDAGAVVFFGRDAGTGAWYDQAALINVMFTGAGTIGAGIWNVGTLPLAIGNSGSVGWKSAGCTGLNLAALTTDTHTSATIDSQTTEYDTRDHILNRVVTVANGATTGFAAAATTWDLTSLAAAFGAP